MKYYYYLIIGLLSIIIILGIIIYFTRPIKINLREAESKFNTDIIEIKNCEEIINYNDFIKCLNK